MMRNKWIGFMGILLLSATFLLSSPKAVGEKIKKEEISYKKSHSVDSEYLESLKAFNELMGSIKSFQMRYGNNEGRACLDDSPWQTETGAAGESIGKKEARE